MNAVIFFQKTIRIKSDTDEPVESAVERMKAALGMLTQAIDTGRTNPTQNVRLE